MFSFILHRLSAFISIFAFMPNSSAHALTNQILMIKLNFKKKNCHTRTYICQFL